MVIRIIFHTLKIIPLLLILIVCLVLGFFTLLLWSLSKIPELIAVWVVEIIANRKYKGDKSKVLDEEDPILVKILITLSTYLLIFGGHLSEAISSLSKKAKQLIGYLPRTIKNKH